MIQGINLTPKAKDFLYDFDTELDFLEGTIRSGKTVISIPKCLLRWADSDEELFIIAGKDTPTVERNVLLGKAGLLNQFKGYVQYKQEIGGKVILFNTPKGLKRIYPVGYGDVSRWEKILGGTFGGGLIDEIDRADRVFITEYFGRLSSVDNPYTCATANPNDPNLQIYHDYLNRSRPHPDYKDSVPPPITAELLSHNEPIHNWRYWHFNFNDNPVMTQDKIEAAKARFPKDSVYYRTKIEGIRAKAEGIIYRSFADNPEDFILDKVPHDLIMVNVGVDFGGNKSAHAFVATGFTAGMKKVIILESKRITDEIDPQQLDTHFVNFCKMVKEKYGFGFNVRTDNAEPVLSRGLKNAAIQHRLPIAVKPALKRKITSRIELVVKLMATGRFFFMRNTTDAQAGFIKAIWDERKPDTRLDDGTTDIDIVDATEYSIEEHTQLLLDAEFLR